VQFPVSRTHRQPLGSALKGLTVVGAVTLAVASSLSVGAQARSASRTADCISAATCYTPHQLEVAYGVQPLLQRRIDGRGETVVLPELAESRLSPPVVTDLRKDLAVFDHLFHLPTPRLRFLSTFAGPKRRWLAYGEEVLDAELVHTIAPRAALVILLVKGNSLDSADQAVRASVAALRMGASDGGIISLSPAGQIGRESCVTHTQLTELDNALQDDAHHHVTVVAATGDSGAAGEPCALIDALSGGISSSFVPRKEVILVASDPLVLSAGGTTLHASHPAGTWTGETTWGLPDGNPGTGFQASGGGFSHVFSRPAYQNRVPRIGSKRSVPDVAADANPNPGSGVPVVTSNPGGGYTFSGGRAVARARLRSGFPSRLQGPIPYLLSSR
jgi:subtilase family serine protease